MKFLAMLGIVFFAVPVFAENFFYGKLLGGTQLVDRTMNPAISMNGLFLGNWGSAIETGKGVQIQELEGQFTAAVDPYFFANFILSSEGGGPLEVEEGWVITLGLPVVSFKTGKFLTNFGKNNLIHTHAQALIDRPLVNRLILGEEAFNSVGIQADILVPLPWYVNLSLAAVSAKMAGLFSSAQDENLANVTHLENLWDLTDSTTLGLGVSYSFGENIQAKLSQFLGLDLSIKYLSPKGRGNFAVIWTNEIISGERPGLVTSSSPSWEHGWGVYSSLMARIHPVIWMGCRWDQVNLTAIETTKEMAENFVIAYVPTEFSTVRFQSGLSQKPGVSGSRWQSLVQLNVTIGSHPAHAY